MYLFGASGHGKVIAEIAEACDFKIKAFIDADMTKNELLDYPVIHSIPKEVECLLISIGNNRVRKKVVLENSNLNYLSLFHPSAIISKRTTVKSGTVIMSGVVVNSNTQIGSHCIINTNASVDHDCIIEDFVHISPNVALAGNVMIGEGTHIGVGASIIPGVTIGKWCIIGAGAVIVNDIPDGATVVGVPGRIIKFHND